MVVVILLPEINCSTFLASGKAGESVGKWHRCMHPCKCEPKIGDPEKQCQKHFIFPCERERVCIHKGEKSGVREVKLQGDGNFQRSIIEFWLQLALNPLFGIQFSTNFPLFRARWFKLQVIWLSLQWRVNINPVTPDLGRIGALASSEALIIITKWCRNVIYVSFPERIESHKMEELSNFYTLHSSNFELIGIHYSEMG